MDEEQLQRMDKLSREVITVSRNTLLVNLRFLDTALSRLACIPCDSSTLLTDGDHLLYNPRHVLKCYRQEKESCVRDYLHIVMHCVFRHMYVPTANRPLWDLACDIAVENVITGLDLPSADAARRRQQQSVMAELKKNLKFLNAERIYRYYLDRNITPVEAATLRGAFYADNHEIWYMTEKERAAVYGIGQGSGEAEQEWKDVSEHVLNDLETFSRRQGILAGDLIQNLEAVNRERYNYEGFLKKFAVRGEVMKIDPDEFDQIFYTYGLQTYGKMPLIEPLEYKEVKRIREFVIAIDTSGSVAGDLVQTFVQKTYNILKSTESFFSKINLHIIQCDAKIQEDTKITNQAEFDEYLKTMKLRGLGGTDFRPVFRYVDELRRNKEFANLKGLIYFTDGFGTFPAQKPDYDTTFVFVDDEYNNPDVPPWAIKLVLQRDEI